MHHPLSFTNVTISNHNIERVNMKKLLDVLLDENLSWKKHIKYLENRIAKNIGLMFSAKSFLDYKSLLALHYSYIHPYLNYAILAGVGLIE